MGGTLVSARPRVQIYRKWTREKEGEKESESERERRRKRGLSLSLSLSNTRYKGDIRAARLASKADELVVALYRL